MTVEDLANNTVRLLAEKVREGLVSNYRVFFFTGPTPKSSKYKIMLEYLDWSRSKS